MARKKKYAATGWRGRSKHLLDGEEEVGSYWMVRKE